MRPIRLLFIGFIFAAGVAHAQDSGALAERIERLERDVNFVQKQVYRGGSGDGASAGVPVNAGQAQVRFTQIDEEIRQIRGLIEQVQFQNKQTATELKKLSEDVDYRLRAIEQKQAEAAATAAAAPAPAPVAAAEPAEEEAAAPTPATAPATKQASASVTEPKPAAYKPEKPALTGKDFPDANAHYSYAFKLLNEKKYAEAAASFDALVKKYPKDPLTGNAYYWLGESQYVRNDFTRSADSFRKGFEVNPDAPKAPDNLYKLAMSLSKIKRTSEACIVLSQVINKYSESAARTAVKAEEARATLQCK